MTALPHSTSNLIICPANDSGAQPPRFPSVDSGVLASSSTLVRYPFQECFGGKNKALPTEMSGPERFCLVGEKKTCFFRIHNKKGFRAVERLTHICKKIEF